LLAAAFLAAACSSQPLASSDASPEVSDIRSLRWLAPGADKVKFLTTQPASCETRAVSPEQEETRKLGKLAFESPALLGGAAARMELSCASCHINGRGNPDFFLEGVSDKPGTADVTSSLLSKVRGDGVFNPAPIPDIALRDGKQIADRTGGEFFAKVHGLIAEEFDGQEPPKPVIDAVIAYMDGLAPSACVSGAPVLPVQLGADLEAAEAAWNAAGKPGLDEATRIFYLRAARYRLGRIHERFVGPRLAPQRAELLALSNGFGEMANAARDHRALTIIAPDWIALARSLGKGERQSLYNPDVLRAALVEE
jgi:hypothetical protein